LVAMTNNAPVGLRQSMAFAYDWKGRRIQKQISTNGVVMTNTTFIYDGWNPIAKLNAANNAVVQSYHWGLDLSGSMQGAGGVGGLLEINDTANGVQFVAYDGNGNVAALVNGVGGTNSAQYEYGPFGELIRSTGPMAKANPFRFSTKFQDDETDLLYYGYRYYNGSTGRWISRDPIEERGGLNLYAFVRNNPLSSIDARGLTACEKCGVNSISLTFSGFHRDASSYWLVLIGEVGFKTKHNDGPQYNSECCKVIQYQKTRATVNGKPVTTAVTGGPLDGSWHVDASAWSPQVDDPATPGNNVAGTNIRYDDDGEIDWMQDSSDAPGHSGLGDGTTFDRTSSFQWKVYDVCNDPTRPKLVKASRVIKMHVWSTGWPEVRFTYTR